MSSRDTFVAAVVTAGKAKIVAVNNTIVQAQTTADASGTVVGYNLATGNYPNFAAALKASAIVKRDGLYAAEQAKQAAIDAARDALRATGDTAPA